MLYSILCYHSEEAVGSWSAAQDAAVMEKLIVVQKKLAQNGKLGPVIRLMPTSTATTLRKEQSPPIVVDGPFAETKEQIGGYVVIECADLDAAVQIAAGHPLARTAKVEVRPYWDAPWDH